MRAISANNGIFDGTSYQLPHTAATVTPSSLGSGADTAATVTPASLGSGAAEKNGDDVLRNAMRASSVRTSAAVSQERVARWRDRRGISFMDGGYRSCAASLI